MKAEELRAKSATELNTMLLQLKKEQFNLRFQKASAMGDRTALRPHAHNTVQLPCRGIGAAPSPAADSTPTYDSKKQQVLALFGRPAA